VSNQYSKSGAIQIVVGIINRRICFSGQREETEPRKHRRFSQTNQEAKKFSWRQGGDISSVWDFSLTASLFAIAFSSANREGRILEHPTRNYIRNSPTNCSITNNNKS